jgi:hypothetical protein
MAQYLLLAFGTKYLAIINIWHVAEKRPGCRLAALLLSTTSAAQYFGAIFWQYL